MSVEVQRVSDGKRFAYHGDLASLPGFGGVFALDGVDYRRLAPRLNTVIKGAKGDGYFSSMQVPNREGAIARGIPLAPHYTSDGDAAFTSRAQAMEYAQKLNQSSEGAPGEYAYDA